MKTQVIVYDTEIQEVLGGMELTDEQADLLYRLHEADYLNDKLIFINVNKINFEKL